MNPVDTAVQDSVQAATHGAEKDPWRVLMVALIAALLLFPSLRRAGLAGYDDALWADRGKEMVRTGDWWSVHFNGSLTMEHPPLFPWLEALSFKLFGVHDWAAKLPSAFFGLATIVLVYFLAMELGGNGWLALLAMLVLSSTQFFLKNATHAMTDVTFTFFFTLAIFFYLKGLKEDVYLALIGLPLAAAILTRSAAGLLALGIVLVHLVSTRRYKTLWSPWLISGIALGVLLSGGWYWSQYRLHGSEFVLSHFRNMNSLVHSNYGPSTHLPASNYLLALLKYYWPWLPFLVAGTWKEARAAFKEGNSNAKLLLIWMLLVIVPFSLAKTKIPRYMMPVLPAFSIVAAIPLYGMVPARWRRTSFNAACAVGCAAVGLSFLFAPKGRAEDIIRLAPVAQVNSSADQRVLFYTYEDGRTDYMWQFLWYSDRYALLADDLNHLAARLQQAEGVTTIADKQSFGKLKTLVPDRTARILGESENLICFQMR